MLVMEKIRIALVGIGAIARSQHIPVPAASRDFTLTLLGEAGILGKNREYARLYERFAALVRAGKSDVDLTPFQLVADAFLLGEWRTTDPFED
jgi:predicted dehydrogenase